MKFSKQKVPTKHCATHLRLLPKIATKYSSNLDLIFPFETNSIPGKLVAITRLFFLSPPRAPSLCIGVAERSPSFLEVAAEVGNAEEEEDEDELHTNTFPSLPTHTHRRASICFFSPRVSTRSSEEGEFLFAYPTGFLLLLLLSFALFLRWHFYFAEPQGTSQGRMITFQCKIVLVLP